MKKKTKERYPTTRIQYKNVKKYDRTQFDDFCSKIYAEGYQDGSSSVPQIDSGAVMAAVQTVKGIGVKRLAQIEAAVSALFSTGNGGAADGSRN